MSRIVFCDFNGTISDKDMLGTLAASCGDDGPADTLDRVSFDGISLRERIASLGARITISLDDAERVLDDRLRFDESFKHLHQACRAAGVELIILTSGIAELIKRYLARRGVVGLRIAGNEAEYLRDGWRIQFRDDSPDGNAKFPYVIQAQQQHRQAFLIGDDESDFEAAVVADGRFAKRNSPLDRFLSANSLAHVVFDTFDEIVPGVAGP